ncbi:MAG: hypothetical protein ABGX16_12100 [Pirellulales bacterium]
MKIVLLKALSCADGNGFPGTILDLPEITAKKYLNPVEPDPDNPGQTRSRDPIARKFVKADLAAKPGRIPPHHGLQKAERDN